MYFKVEKRRVPVVSSLVPCSPQYRLLGIISGNNSRPMCYVMSNYTHSVPARDHNCVGVELADFSSMENRLPRDLYFNSQGQPVEVGYGHILTLEFQSLLSRVGQAPGLSSMNYELLLTMCQIKSYISLHDDIATYFMARFGKSLCYVPIDSSLSTLALKYPEMLPINDSYESIVRFMSGANQYEATVRDEYNRVFMSFMEAMTCETSSNPSLDQIHSKTRMFRLHRIVSGF